jgi:hypothetical protein
MDRESYKSLSPMYNKENLLYKYAIEKKFFETYELAEFLLDLAHDHNQKLLICIAQYDEETLLASACVLIYNNCILEINRDNLWKNWKELNSLLTTSNKITSGDILKYFEAEGIEYDLNSDLDVMPLKMNGENYTFHLGYLIYSNKMNHPHNFSIGIDSLNYMLKLNVHTYSYSETINTKKVFDYKQRHMNAQKESIGKDVYSYNESGLLKLVLHLAMVITDSIAGSIYIYDQLSDKLKLFCYNGELPPNEFFDYKISPKNVIAHCFERDRFFITNDVSKINLIYKNIYYYSAFKEIDKELKIAELAIPLRYMARTSNEIIGVLNIEKINSTYNISDVEIIKNEIIHKFLSINELSRQSNEINTLLIALLDELNQEHIQHFNRFKRCAQFIRLAMKAGIKNTPAFSSSFRIFNPKTECLDRFIQEGDRIDTSDQFKGIKLSQFRKSAVANAFITGDERYIPNIQRYMYDKKYRYDNLDSVIICRPGMKAEYCIPIYFKKRVISTLNFESNIEDAFDSHIKYLSGIAKLIELQIFLDNQKIEQAAFKEKTRIYYTLHDLLQIVPDFLKDIKNEKKNNVLQKSKSSLSKSLQEIHKQIEGLTDYYKTPKLLNDKISDNSLYQLINSVIEKHDISEITKVTSDADYILEKNVSDNLYMALDNILVNVIKASSYSDIIIIFNKLKLRNIKSVNIRIGSRSVMKLKDDEINKIYQLPIEVNNKMRLGSFVAGCLIREVSGFIYITDDIYHEPYLKTIIEVPYIEEIGNGK